MTDRELLEYAAKAAGIDVESCGKNIILRQTLCSTRRMGSIWNPLTDDGDALRLAVKLGLNIMQQPESEYNFPWVCVAGTDIEVDENYENDKYAATRRAIVRAAAEIGKAMQ